VPQDIIDGMLDIMPSPKLVINEYKKHGTCSGLSPRDYYDAARRAYGSIRIPERFVQLQQPLSISPEEVRRAFLEANPNLAADMIQIGCSRNLLRDVRICLSKDFKPRNCSQAELSRNMCRSHSVTMPPIRGGGTGPHGGPSGI
jgi:ribonuclease T2